MRKIKQKIISFYDIEINKDKIKSKFKTYCKNYLEEIGHFNILNSFLNEFKIDVSKDKEKELREYLYKEVLEE